MARRFFVALTAATIALVAIVAVAQAAKRSDTTLTLSYGEGVLSGRLKTDVRKCRAFRNLAVEYVHPDGALQTIENFARSNRKGRFTYVFPNLGPGAEGVPPGTYTALAHTKKIRVHGEKVRCLKGASNPVQILP